MSCDMWFGTQDYATWIQTPQRGADVSAHGWNESGNFLNGGAFAFNSYNTHKEFDFSWRTTSNRKEAQTLMSFYSGTFGRGKLYFLDPLTMRTNVLPARWADPSITCDFEGESLVPGLDPLRVSQTDTARLQLPVTAAQYPFSNHLQGNPRDVGVFVPLPPGHTAVVWGVSNASGGVGVAPAVQIGSVSSGGSVTHVGGLPNTYPGLISTRQDGAVLVSAAPGVIGVQIWFGGSSSGSTVTGTLTVNALSVEVVPSDEEAVYLASPREHWYGGQGNEGVRFLQPPTYINQTGRDGGQIEFAATFTEVSF